MFALTLTSALTATAPVAGESWCVQGVGTYCAAKGLELRLDSAKPQHESPISIRNFAGANQEMGT
jgi:hypothetical protein